MTENIKIKIIKLHHKETQKRNNIEHKHAIYEVEPFDYGDHNYSLINIEYQNESDLHEFAAGKNINIQVGEDMTLGEGSTLMIKGGAWNADRTIWQKIGDTSAQTVKKTGEG